jgi:hypothetical protein
VARREREPRDPDVPRLPRGKGFRLSFGEIVRIGLTGTMLLAVLVLAKPCADSVGRFVANFDPPDAQQPPPSTKLPAGYVHLGGDMSPQQIEPAVGGLRDAAAPARDAAALPPDAGAPPPDAPTSSRPR